MGAPAAFNLLGLQLPNGWRVTERIGWYVDAAGNPMRSFDGGTGGNFSVCYGVEKGDQKAFLKAIDLSKANRPGVTDVLGELKKIVDTATFEKELCLLCGDRRMDRVVLALATGDHSFGPNLQDNVPYIVFELADGDVRRRVRKVADSIRIAWIFRAAHNAAVGLTQLHSARVAHQDVKPSNVLHFENQNAFKLGDMGRAIREGVAVPHADYGIAGDPTYAPPELLYGHYDPDWRTRRLGCDIFMLGSLVAFFFLGQGITPLIFTKLDPAFIPRRYGGDWTGTYIDALSGVRRGFSEVLVDLEPLVPSEFREEVVSAVAELCEPDASLRGHPRDRRLNQFSLQRYVSLFNLLADKAQIAARRG